MLEKLIRISRLYDCYGALLTERQQKCIELHYLQDLSLGEIAAELGVSRQAVNDILKRTEDSLDEYEVQLQLLQQQQARSEALQKLRRLLLEAVVAGHPADETLRQALAVADAIQ